MGLSRYEQETVIGYNNAEDVMTVYTADPALMRRLSRLSAYRKIREDKNNGKVVSMTFEADKRLVTLRNKRVVSTQTAEQKDAARKRMQELNKNR